MKIFRCLVLALAVAAPAAAQTDGIAIRPFGFGSIESFAAADTFDAVFQRTFEPFFGGGVQVLFDDKYVVELSASRFSQTGQRAFISNGQKFRLGIPLKATLTPLEATIGYRFMPARRSFVVYGAAGGGLYFYKESSDFADQTASPPANGVDLDARHAGFVVNGGVETRVSRLIRVAVDVQYTRVPGILGSGGVSQQAGESDLGGVAGRVKLVVGR